MRLDPWLLKTVVYVGFVDRMGQFAPRGTGFLVTYLYKDHLANMILTARHVVDDEIPGDEVSYRLNDHQGEAKVITLPKKLMVSYHPNPSVDLVAISVRHDPSVYDAMFYGLDRKKKIDWLDNFGGIQLGEEVVTVGLYTSHYGLTKNVPVVRTGNVAAIPSEPINCLGKYTRGFLVEVRSIGGLSGSPVFLVVPPIFRKNNQLCMAPRFDMHPIGILLGHHSLDSEKDEIPVPQFQHGTAGPQPLPRMNKNTGLGVVATLDYAFDIVEGEEFMAACEKDLEALALASGFVPDAASVPKEKAIEGELHEANPDHREAFTSLLNAAVRKPPQAD